MTRTRLTTRFFSLSLLATLVAAPLVGCSGDDRKDTATNGDTTGDTSTGSTTNDSASSTSASGSGTAGETTGGSTTATTNTSVTTTSTTGVEPQPDGSMCTDDAECISGHCFNVPLLGGLCGECNSDADCDGGGCTIPNPLMMQGASCNKGEKGAGCETDDVCTDPNAAICGLVLDATPILKVTTCGECETNADCPGDKPNCSPTISVADFSGVLECVPDNTVPNDSACNFAEEGGVPIGNSACMSGKCGVASVMGIIQIGVCGDCFTDADCDMGQTCTDAYLDEGDGSLHGAVCG
ncbi:MAG: hypothetical protein H6710_08620 [Myxococcales bacterium]|nr:hypothetical protein [Myxococcales bacterium]MCB9704308.1 hypothetical protein [Myxococcales bacterium]